MKNLILISTLLISFTFKAQMAVVDVGANSQLATIQSEIATMMSTISAVNGQMTTLNTTQGATKAETIANTKQTLDQLGISKAAEDFLKKVPMYLKQGNEIKQILSKEQVVVRKIQNLNNLFNANNIPQSTRNLLLNSATGLLNASGDAVDLGLNLLTDDMFRMETENRREYLKEISAQMDSIISAIGSIESQVSSYSVRLKANQDYKNAYDNVNRTIKH